MNTRRNFIATVVGAVAASSTTGAFAAEPASKTKDAGHAALDVIAKRVAQLDGMDREFCIHAMKHLIAIREKLEMKPTPNALSLAPLSKSQFLTLYRILLCYLFVMLFVDDRRAKSAMRRLVTDITEGRPADTDRICDDLELGRSEGQEDPRVQLARVAWREAEACLPVQRSELVKLAVTTLALPAHFDFFRDDVRHLFR